MLVLKKKPNHLFVVSFALKINHRHLKAILLRHWSPFSFRFYYFFDRIINGHIFICFDEVNAIFWWFIRNADEEVVFIFVIMNWNLFFLFFVRSIKRLNFFSIELERSPFSSLEFSFKGELFEKIGERNYVLIWHFIVQRRERVVGELLLDLRINQSFSFWAFASLCINTTFIYLILRKRAVIEVVDSIDGRFLLGKEL